MGFDKKLALEASAGSGKTFALVVRYITLLFLEANPKNILALTFTNKAANEMKVRIFSTIKELHLDKRKSELQEIANKLKSNPQEILSRRDKILEKFLTSKIKILTIDSFLSLILRQFAFEFHMQRDFEIKNLEKQKLYIAFLSKTIEKGLYLDLVNLAIYENKTLESIFKLFENIYEKDSFLKNIHFNNVKPDENSVMMAFYAFYEVMQECFGLSPTAQKQLENDSIFSLKERTWICKESLGEYKFFKKCANSLRESRFSELKNRLKEYYKIYEEEFFYHLFALYKIFKEESLNFKRINNKLEFNDITNVVYDILATINNDFLYFRLDFEIEHLLIDEFQDTSITQYKILEPIFNEIDLKIKNQEFKSLFYVGDVKQSIYRFRGGVKELFYYMQRNFDIKKEFLNKNYRSYNKIVEFVNNTFSGKIKNYQNQISIDDNDRGFVEVIESDDLLEEIKNKVDYLISLGINIKDITILTHTNDDSSLVEEYLIENLNIKVTTETSQKLIHHSTIKALIEFIKYIYFEKDFFKANFLSLIGRSFDEIIDGKYFSKEDSLTLLIDKAIKTFSLKIDKSLLKFIEISYKFKDIEDFLYNYEYISENVDKEDSDGVKILTIHKSKGLEFEYLFVCDRFSKKRSSGDSILYEYDDINLKAIYKKTKSKECFDTNYFNALEKEKILEIEDEMNAHYVAFTRAKNSLFIMKQNVSSSFEYLNLKQEKIGQILIKQKKDESKIGDNFLYEKLNLNQNMETIAKIKSQEDGVEQKTIDFGLAVHYLLEIIYKFDKTYLLEAFINTKNRYSLYLEESDFEKIKIKVEKLLDNKFFHTLLENSVKIYKEQPLMYKKELYQIDLLVEKEDVFIIVDYKTSNFVSMTHKKQISRYKEAIQSIFNKKVISFLCYLRDEDILFEVV